MLYLCVWLCVPIEKSKKKEKGKLEYIQNECYFLGYNEL